MMKINQIWEELENDSSFPKGLLLRRYSGSFLPHVYIALKNPERQRSIAAIVSKTLAIDLTSFSNLKDIGVILTHEEDDPDRHILLVSLITRQYADIFTVLCEDLISSISSVTSESLLIKELFNRFEKWISLFEQASMQGLTHESQIGLFGELVFLRMLLKNFSDFHSSVTSWVGQEKQIRDFQLGKWSVEVKTTHGNNHQKVHISSERQLDISNLENLFLYHISLEIRQQSGETLNALVDSIYEILKDDFATLLRFKAKLLEGGYFDKHRSLYEDNGYFIRQDIFYLVENDFPRIEEKDIRNGVGDVKYSIIVSQCSDYIKTEKEVIQIIGNV